MRYIETIFKYFDKIIISSKSIKDIEKKTLAKHVGTSQWTDAFNCWNVIVEWV